MSIRFKVGDIYIFGKFSTPFAKSDIDLIVADPTTEFHILRHYVSLPNEYKKSLIGQKYSYYDYKKQGFTESVISEEDVKEGLKTKGSKFSNNVAGIETPRTLLVQIRNQLKKLIGNDSLIWVDRGSYQTVAFTFNYDKEVGYLDLINIATLTEEEKAHIKKVPRGSSAGEDDIVIQTISGIIRKPTKSIAVELTKVAGRSYLSVTAYPGTLSPDFPSLGQNTEEREYCKEFWDDRVFIV
ncbi:MAG: hypothetical protein WC988_03085 [Patescibacteria group bacterium]